MKKRQSNFHSNDSLILRFGCSIFFGNPLEGPFCEFPADIEIYINTKVIKYCVVSTGEIRNAMYR